MSTLHIVPLAMLIFAIAAGLALGSRYRKYYKNYSTRKFPIILLLATIPSLGIYGYYENSTLFTVVSTVCMAETAIFALLTFKQKSAVIAIFGVVVGLLAGLFSYLITDGPLTLEKNTIGLFCCLFAYLQVIIISTILLELLKNGLKITH